MKKCLLLLALILAFVAAPAVSANEFTERLPEKLLFYLPNRFIDAFDLFSVNVGVGPKIEARLMCTRAIDVGAGWGMTAKIYKNYNRQYGVGIEEGWYWYLVSIGEEHHAQISCTMLVDSGSYDNVGFPRLNQPMYDIIEGSRDYFQIGGALGLLIDGEVFVHPIEWVDFALGFFFIDIKNDDLSLDNFR